MIVRLLDRDGVEVGIWREGSLPFITLLPETIVVPAWTGQVEVTSLRVGPIFGERRFRRLSANDAEAIYREVPSAHEGG